MLVSHALTTTRSVTRTGSLNITLSSEVLKSIDNKITGQYSVAVSNSSATSETITGTLGPVKKSNGGSYSYNWINFAPRLKTITGYVTLYQMAGTMVFTVSSQNFSSTYPIKRSGNPTFTDGNYTAAGADSYASVTQLA